MLLMGSHLDDFEAHECAKSKAHPKIVLSQSNENLSFLLSKGTIF